MAFKKNVELLSAVVLPRLAQGPKTLEQLQVPAYATARLEAEGLVKGRIFSLAPSVAVRVYFLPQILALLDEQPRPSSLYLVSTAGSWVSRIGRPTNKAYPFCPALTAAAQDAFTFGAASKPLIVAHLRAPSLLRGLPKRTSGHQEHTYTAHREPMLDSVRTAFVIARSVLLAMVGRARGRTNNRRLTACSQSAPSPRPHGHTNKRS